MADRWEHVRVAARDERTRLAGSPGPAGVRLVERLLACRGFEVIRYPPHHQLLSGAWAALFPDMDLAICDGTLSAQRQAFALAHELGHLSLHAAASACGQAEIDSEADAGPEGTLAIYNPRQQRELEANLFALHLLLPPDQLMDLFVRRGLDSRAIARRLGVSVSAVRNALAGLLVGGAPSASRVASPVPAGHEPSLDASQRAAATITGARAIVRAGPGTGKTATLVGRVLHLVRTEGAAPSRVLVVTFSNRAVGELRFRLAAALGAEARNLTVSTLHAFCFELLRRYSAAAGLPPDFALVDKASALLLLRAHLATFDQELAALDETISLERPLATLSGLLDIVSRAKDECLDAAAFAARIVAQEQPDAAARVQAAFYRWYEEVLAGAPAGPRHGLDHGDLILRAVRLLQGNEAIRAEVRAAYPHVLVDEYQDLNLACATLIDLLAPGASLWAVGDSMQSIYRWRGARPEALADLHSGDHAAPALGVNYRSAGPIVRLCAGVAAAMAGEGQASDAPRWETTRTAPSQEPAIVLATADDEPAELAGVVSEIRRALDGGTPSAAIAVLCATNAQADHYAATLRESGIPVCRPVGPEDEPALHDVLAVPALAAGEAEALLRLARDATVPADGARPAPLISKETALALIRHAVASGQPLRALLRRPPTDLSADERAAARRLASFLRSLPVKGERLAWTALARYLFDAPYMAARPALAADGCGAREALGALLACARAYDAASPDLREPSLPRHVRLLLSAGEALPAMGQDMEGPGVRVLTVHAAKGLEFSLVFLPGLARGRFPGRGRNGAAVAQGVLDWDEKAARAADERCLFFVALSRARDRLILSRAERYAGRAHEPTTLLALTETAFAAEPPAAVRWSSAQFATSLDVPVGRDDAPPHQRHEQPDAPAVEMQALEQYLRCPRRYYYAQVLGLRGAVGQGFGHYHQALRQTLARLARTPDVDEDAGLRMLAEEWRAPHEAHPHEALYWERACRVVRARTRTAPEQLPTGGVSRHDAEYVVPLQAGAVRVRIDRLDQAPGTPPVAIRFHGGAPADGHRREHRTALYQAALDRAHGQGRVAQHYLLSGAVDTATAQTRTLESRLREADAALAGIARGDFMPRRSEECPGCPFWLICPEG